MKKLITLVPSLSLLVVGCLSKAPEGIGEAPARATTVKFDFFHRPLPEIPLPNDIATRYDATSPTGRRINASLVAETLYERRTRQQIDQLDGWGVFQPITVPFTGPLSVESITKAHPPDDFAFGDDVVLLVNVDPDSEAFGTFQELDVGGGNYPVVLEKLDRYWPNDPRGGTNSLVFEEVDEDKNGNGTLDRGEDSDADGVLDKPNYLPGKSPDPTDLAGRADALMTFYDRETHSLLVRPMVPLREQTTYAVVITTKLLDEAGAPVGSPFPWKSHESQADALAPLGGVLSKQGLSLNDVAFAFTFTTQSVAAPWLAVRDGLYGHGVQAHLGQEFPPEVGGLETLLDLTYEPFAGRNPYVMHNEDWALPLSTIASTFLNAPAGSLRLAKLEQGHSYIDFHIVGWFEAPQLFERTDAAGNLLSLNDQSWPADLDRVKAKTRRERVYFHLTVPRKEASARGAGKPAPIVVLGHGYTGNRFDAVSMGGYFARHGLAALSIDNVSHGIELSPDEQAQASQILGLFGLGPALDAMTLRHRSFDQNGDERADSGVDFWTAYLFHTRDVVRQSALDYMQLVRVFRAFDGSRKFNFDADGDGKLELAGDFDADGVIDVGGDGPIHMLGASLGGIMSTVVGALEPELDAVVPIAAGGGLGDVALRSIQGGVPEAVILRMLGPLFLGTGPVGGSMHFETVVPNANRGQTVALGSVDGVKAGDFLRVVNRSAATRSCGYVFEDAGTLRWRTGLEANDRDLVAIEVYEGDAMVLGSTECEVEEGATPRLVFDRWEADGGFQDRSWKAGSDLRTLAEGLGLPRASPRIRRFLGLAQLVLDACDPAVMAPFMQQRPITYPGTGQTTQTDMLLVTTAGDMNVPASTGVTITRAAGLVDYRTPHPDYGTSLNQVLIDTFTVEAVDTIKRYVDSAGTPTIMDIENFSGDNDLWAGLKIPRLDPPLRLGFDRSDTLRSPISGPDGVSAAIFPFPKPEGEHGFDFPGGFIDTARAKCTAACTTGDGCGCADISAANHFDIGSFMFNMMARYLATGGSEVSADACLSRDDCDFFEPVPTVRDLSGL